jgi:hypothetical protein
LLSTNSHQCNYLMPSVICFPKAIAYVSFKWASRPVSIQIEGQRLRFCRTGGRCSEFPIVDRVCRVNNLAGWRRRLDHTVLALIVGVKEGRQRYGRECFCVTIIVLIVVYESPTFPQVKALLSAAYVFLVAGIIKPIIELRQKLWRRNRTITGLQTYCNSQMLREFLM